MPRTPQAVGHALAIIAPCDSRCAAALRSSSCWWSWRSSASLVALLLPAVQMARESARRAAMPIEPAATRRRDGAARQRARHVSGRLPGLPRRFHRIAAVTARFISWNVQLLPFLEEDAVAARVRLLAAVVSIAANKPARDDHAAVLSLPEHARGSTANTDGRALRNRLACGKARRSPITAASTAWRGRSRSRSGDDAGASQTLRDDSLGVLLVRRAGRSAGKSSTACRRRPASRKRSFAARPKRNGSTARTSSPRTNRRRSTCAASRQRDWQPAPGRRIARVLRRARRIRRRVDRARRAQRDADQGRRRAMRSKERANEERGASRWRDHFGVGRKCRIYRRYACLILLLAQHSTRSRDRILVRRHRILGRHRRESRGAGDRLARRCRPSRRRWPGASAGTAPPTAATCSRRSSRPIRGCSPSSAARAAIRTPSMASATTPTATATSASTTAQSFDADGFAFTGPADLAIGHRPGRLLRRGLVHRLLALRRRAGTTRTTAAVGRISRSDMAGRDLTDGCLGQLGLLADIRLRVVRRESHRGPAALPARRFQSRQPSGRS